MDPRMYMHGITPCCYTGAMTSTDNRREAPTPPCAVAHDRALDTSEAEATAAATGPFSGALSPTVGLGFDNVATLVFQSLLLRRGALHLIHRQWNTSTRAVDVAWPAVCSSANRRLASDSSWVFDRGDVVIRLFLSADGVAEASFAATEAALLDGAEEAVLELLPREDVRSDFDPDALLIPITFWCWGGGRRSTRRKLVVPSWAEIDGNYAASTRTLLEPLFDGFRPAREGQLILWHGPPGTGKTHAIRALAHAWRSWCDAHYVTDPEVFFGQPAAYMRDVLLDNDDYEFEQREDEDDTPGADGRWRLLVLEDTGELLNIDAKLDVGQGLSRLLNVVDGLLGQGLRMLVLITTNEPIARLHPAVVRPGRCAATVAFPPLPVGEANDWLQARGTAPEATAATSLAELYNLHAGGQPPSTGERRLGFA